MSRFRSVRPFTLVLAGGGARGYAHVGVIRALEHMGLSPAGMVGVSMGAVVAATYAARDDWYDSLLSIDVSGSPPSGRAHASHDERAAAVRRAWVRARTAWNMVTGWGAPDDAAVAARAALNELIGPGRLEEGRIPVTVCATDLLSGSRVEFASGPTVPAVYASSALAGILPPLEHAEFLLADGAYTDIAPVDVARKMGAQVVIAIDMSQGAGAESIRNGLQAVMRAMEICHLNHAHLSVERADLVLRPAFDRAVDVLDFGARRVCVSAGVRAVRASRDALEQLLGS